VTFGGLTARVDGRTQTREGARHRRLARRHGKAKTCVATGNTQLKAYHKLLSNPGMRYPDPGPDYYERQRDSHRQIACHHAGKLGAVGFDGVTEPGGGICPGPLCSQASWAGPAGGWARVGGWANAGWFRSRKSDRSAAAASRLVIAGRFHFRSTIARIEVLSWTTLVT
jgi:anti-sigma factor RsiW